MNILSYSKQFKTNWDGFDDIIMPKTKDDTPSPEPETETVKAEEKTPSTEPVSEVIPANKNENSALEFAKMLKEKYSYSDALLQFADALSFSIEHADTIQTIEILEHIADCYFNLGDYSNSIENFGKAHELAKSRNMTNKCYEIMLKIAEVYKNIYKKDLAVEIYKDICAQEGLDENIKLTAELNLFEASFSSMKPNEIFKKYHNLLDKAQNNKFISAKIHFRLGFLYDKASMFDNAIKHYNESVSTCPDFRENENLSSCYYNLAEIYSYKKEYDKALETYLKSYSIDEMTGNKEGLLNTSKKIARIYERKKTEATAKLAQKYYEKAVEFAKDTGDNYPIACAIIDLGDFYYRQKQDMKALKIYMSAKKILSNQLTHENEMAIKDRLNDLRVRMGKAAVDKVIKEFS